MSMLWHCHYFILGLAFLASLITATEFRRFSAHPSGIYSRTRAAIPHNLAKCFGAGLLGVVGLTATIPVLYTDGSFIRPSHMIVKAEGMESSRASTTELESANQLARVMYSLDYISDDIDKGVTSQQVITQIKTLLGNYNLKDNIRKTVALVPSGPNREKAYEKGVSAIEDLSAVFEYFNDGMTESKVSPRELLMFAQKATKSAKEDLGFIINECLTKDLAQRVNAKVSAEFSGL